ncbi:MAG: hypothetical protein WC986_14490 [Elusimicrobiota bacterium]
MIFSEDDIKKAVSAARDVLFKTSIDSRPSAAWDEPDEAFYRRVVEHARGKRSDAEMATTANLAPEPADLPPNFFIHACSKCGASTSARRIDLGPHLYLCTGCQMNLYGRIPYPEPA